MKKIVLLAFVVSFLFVGISTVNASYWSIAPTGSLETSIGDRVDYVLSFNYENDLSNDQKGFWGMTLSFEFDASELTYSAVTYDSSFVGWSAFGDETPGNGTLKMDRAVFTSPWTFDAGGKYDVATFTFLVNAENPWDGVADFVLLDQVGSNGVLLKDYDSFANFGDAEGADVGTPTVPIPGAIWLLGSGLLGLVTIRRRRG